MSHFAYCISCMEKSDLVSVHEELSREEYLRTENNPAAIVKHCFNIKILEHEISYAMCTACVSKLIQCCILKDQIQKNLNCDKEFINDDMTIDSIILEEPFVISEIKDDEDYFKQEDNMEAEYLDDAFKYSDSESDTKYANAECDITTRITQSKDEHINWKSLKNEKMQLISEINSMSDYKIKIDDEMADKYTSYSEELIDGQWCASVYAQNAECNTNTRIKQSKEENFIHKSLQAEKMHLINEINSISDYKIKINDEIIIDWEQIIDVRTNNNIVLTDNQQKHEIEEPQLFRKEMHLGKTKSANEIIKEDFRFLLQNCKDFSLFSWIKSKFKCAVCKKFFSDANDYRSHSLKHTPKDLRKVCPSGNFLLCPILKVDISSMKCRHCNKRVRELDTFTSHLSLSHNIQVENPLKRILPFNLNKKDVKCGVCNKGFHNFPNLNIHMNEHTTNYLCSQCGKYFVTLKRLRNHFNNLHTTGKFKCTQCDETFDSFVKRGKHVAAAHRRLNDLCRSCPENFASFNYKLRHSADVHNVELRKYKCEKCPSKFITSTSRSTHFRKIHLKERNYFCSVCGQSFFNSDQLKDHLIKHTGAREFECDKCSKSFSRKRILTHHMQRKHCK